MEYVPLEITGAERAFYGESLILLEGAVEEFLSCVRMIRRYQVSLGRRDPVASFQARIKSAESMKAKLRRKGLPVTAASALEEVRDAAGVRLICPFARNIDQMTALIRQIPGIRILREKDYIRSPKPNGYRSYHMIVEIPVFFSDRKKPMRVEVQIRTIAMDFWASLDHLLKYKKEVINEAEIGEELRQCAETIAQTDQKMYEIRQKIEAQGIRVRK